MVTVHHREPVGPGWEPEWRDVRWDHAAVVAAADRYDVLAAHLGAASAERRQAAQAVLVGFAGLHANRFRFLHAAAVDRLDALAAHLRTAAEQLRAADHHARREQHRREAERRRWFLELEQCSLPGSGR